MVKKFNVGDRVKRIILDNGPTKVGDTGTVTEEMALSLYKVRWDIGISNASLAEYLDKVPTSNKFHLVQDVRPKPVKQIKLGAYNINDVAHNIELKRYYASDNSVLLAVDRNYSTYWSANSARDAAKFFTELADALDIIQKENS